MERFQSGFIADAGASNKRLEDRRHLASIAERVMRLCLSQIERRAQGTQIVSPPIRKDPSGESERAIGPKDERACPGAPERFREEGQVEGGIVRDERRPIAEHGVDPVP